MGSEDSEENCSSVLSSPDATDTEVSQDRNNTPLLALIMTPTRELALQIRNHLQKTAKHTSLRVKYF